MTDTLKCERTPFGFKVGAADVQYMASDGKKGWAVVGVTTPKSRVQIYVTKTGKVRVYRDGVELVDNHAGPSPTT